MTDKDFKPLGGLSEIAENYDAVLCDIWGVMHNGREPFLEACHALLRFRQEVGPVVLISNSPRPSRVIPDQFLEVGVPDGIWDAIVTSGDATINEIARRAPGPAFKLGPDRDDHLYEGMDMNFSDMEDANFITCTGLFDDENETPEDYTELLAEAREHGLDMVCANPDIRVNRGGKLIYCGGALAKVYEDMGGNVIYAGKPHRPIYEMCDIWLDNIMGFVPPKDRILAIGDGIPTDILGAQREGYDAVMVLDGLNAGTDTATAWSLLREQGLTAKYVCPGLKW